MKFFTTPNSKNLIATLRIVTTEKFELIFLLMLYFHSFLHADFLFDVPKCIFIFKKSILKGWLRSRLFLWRIQK